MGCNYQRLIGINGRVICRISIVNQISYETGFFRTILRESTEESIKLLHNIDPFNRTANVGESHHITSQMKKTMRHHKIHSTEFYFEDHGLKMREMSKFYRKWKQNRHL